MRPLIDDPFMALAFLLVVFVLLPCAVLAFLEWRDRRRELMKPDRWPKVGGNPQDLH